MNVQEIDCWTAAACVQHKSVVMVSRQEAAEFRWIESERAGCDLGEPALKRWVKDHWWGFLRARWVQHLQGTCFWIELGQEDFGILEREFQDRGPLLNDIVNHLKDGKENLDIIHWADQRNIPVDPIINILERLDINGHRLIHEYDKN